MDDATQQQECKYKQDEGLLATGKPEVEFGHGGWKLDG